MTGMSDPREDPSTLKRGRSATPVSQSMDLRRSRSLSRAQEKAERRIRKVYRSRERSATAYAEVQKKAEEDLDATIATNKSAPDLAQAIRIAKAADVNAASKRDPNTPLLKEAEERLRKSVAESIEVEMTLPKAFSHQRWAYANPFIYVPCGGCGQSFKLGRKEKNQGGQMEKGLCGGCEFQQRSAKIFKNKIVARKRHKLQRAASAPTGRKKQVDRARQDLLALDGTTAEARLQLLQAESLAEVGNIRSAVLLASEAVTQARTVLQDPSLHPGRRAAADDG